VAISGSSDILLIFVQGERVSRILVIVVTQRREGVIWIYAASEGFLRSLLLVKRQAIG
jgi:hypothetical protein